ncbi:MAG: non-canonical purine NTP pyrophosphatase [Verrucomicrobia bacterium]|nr:non-canonical purine NTP pyrophosphatase [Verrucomicrobiota bacterium]
MTTLIIATRNRHKVLEIQAILGGGFRCVTLENFPGAPEVVEDADTFEGNAGKKSRELAGWIAGTQAKPDPVELQNAFCLADDSGLEVDALNGAPGVISARFAAQDGGHAGNSADAANNAKLLRMLADVPPEKRTARFRCVMALTRIETPPGETKFFDGACEGRIGFTPRGAGGFGYDPLFFPTGFESSFAELGEAVKNTMSHRAKALAELKRHLAGAA